MPCRPCGGKWDPESEVYNVIDSEEGPETHWCLMTLTGLPSNGTGEGSSEIDGFLAMLRNIIFVMFLNAIDRHFYALLAFTHWFCERLSKLLMKYYLPAY